MYSDSSCYMHQCVLSWLSQQVLSFTPTSSPPTLLLLLQWLTQAFLEAELKALPAALGIRGTASPAPSEQQPALSLLPSRTAGSLPPAVAATSDPAAAAAAAGRGSVSGSCSPEVELVLPAPDAASGITALGAKVGAGIGPAAASTAAAAAASHVAAVLGSSGLQAPAAVMPGTNCAAIDAAAVVAALSSLAAGCSSSSSSTVAAVAAAAVAAAAARGLSQPAVHAAGSSSTAAGAGGAAQGPAAAPAAGCSMGLAAPQQQALQWLHNQQVRVVPGTAAS
jgi:hypothetical protein